MDQLYETEENTDKSNAEKFVKRQNKETRTSVNGGNMIKVFGSGDSNASIQNQCLLFSCSVCSESGKSLLDFIALRNMRSDNFAQSLDVFFSEREKHTCYCWKI